jgi:selenocysteine lyase/cysteine desulfurase
MKSEADTSELANELRRHIAELLDVPHAERIVLVPGILIALRILFSHLRVQRVLLTSEEYYAESHFPEQSVRVAPCERIPGVLEGSSVDAVVASPASWKGVAQPVAELFGWMGETCATDAPLRVADYAHAGSVGFPSATSLEADVICGDLEKWILPPDWSSRLAFLWCRTDQLWRRAAEAFRPFFLATASSDVPTLARWVDPLDVVAVSRKLAESRISRASLQEQHRADMKLAAELGGRLRPPKTPATSILWVEEGSLDRETIDDLERRGLVWRFPGRGARVLCRSDVLGDPPSR